MKKKPLKEKTRGQIEKELNSMGWCNTRVDKDCSCGSWPEKHVRVTMWDFHAPILLSGSIMNSIGHEYAEGDGENITEAFRNLYRVIKRGKNKWGRYPNNAVSARKRWKASVRLSKSKTRSSR